jgi:hypothetical protein
MSLSLYVDNNNVLELRHLRNSVTDAFDTGATVTVTLKDASGTDVTGHTFPLTMTHDKSGTYRVTLDDAIGITAGVTYTATVDVTGTGGLVAQWTIPVKAVTRIS